MDGQPPAARNSYYEKTKPETKKDINFSLSNNQALVTAHFDQ